MNKQDIFYNKLQGLFEFNTMFDFFMFCADINDELWNLKHDPRTVLFFDDMFRGNHIVIKELNFDTREYITRPGVLTVMVLKNNENTHLRFCIFENASKSGSRELKLKLPIVQIE